MKTRFRALEKSSADRARTVTQATRRAIWGVVNSVSACKCYLHYPDPSPRDDAMLPRPRYAACFGVHEDAPIPPLVTLTVSLLPRCLPCFLNALCITSFPSSFIKLGRLLQIRLLTTACIKKHDTIYGPLVLNRLEHSPP